MGCLDPARWGNMSEVFFFVKLDGDLVESASLLKMFSPLTVDWSELLVVELSFLALKSAGAPNCSLSMESLGDLNWNIIN